MSLTLALGFDVESTYPSTILRDVIFVDVLYNFSAMNVLHLSLSLSSSLNMYV